MAGVDTALYIAGLASRNAADIVPHMLISYRSFIGAGFDNARIASCDAADIRDGGCVLSSKEISDCGIGIYFR